MKGFLIWRKLKGFLQLVEFFKLSEIIFKNKFPLINSPLTGDFTITDFQSLHENPSCIKLQTMLITILPLLFKTKSRVFHLLLSFIIVSLTLLLQWCLSNVISNAAKTNPFVCCPLLQLFSIFKSNICYIWFWGSISCWYVGGWGRWYHTLEIIRGGLCKYQT